MYHRHGAIKMIATMVAMELMVIVTTNIQKMVAESLVESLVVTVATAERPMTVMQKHSQPMVFAIPCYESCTSGPNAADSRAASSFERRRAQVRLAF